VGLLVTSTSFNGNTSIIVGQCGAVIAPVRPGDGNWYLQMFHSMEGIPLDSQRMEVDFAWEIIPQYLIRPGYHWPRPREPIYAFPGGEMHVKQGAVGIDYVVVNGAVLLDHGEHIGTLPGQTLRGSCTAGSTSACPESHGGRAAQG
jgi:hypothetical protein